MNKKTLCYIALSLLSATFLFSFIGAFAAHLAMTILAIVFSAGAIVCLILSMLDKKRPVLADSTPTVPSEPTPKAPTTVQ